jgi:hypothetical protein
MLAPEKLVISKLEPDCAKAEPVTIVNINPNIIAITLVLLSFAFV